MALDIFAKYATDESLENNGTWHEIGGGAKLLIGRQGNKQYTKTLAKLVERDRKVLDMNDDAANARSDEIMTEVLAVSVLLGWEGIEYKGKPLPYSVENAKMLLRHKDFRRDVVALSENIDHFRAKEEVEQGEA